MGCRPRARRGSVLVQPAMGWRPVGLAVRSARCLGTVAHGLLLASPRAPHLAEQKGTGQELRRGVALPSSEHVARVGRLVRCPA